MRLLEHPTTAVSPSQPGLASYRLRVLSDGRTVDLPLGKTTIGSSARCQLRVQASGVQPLHCLILRDLDGLSVRRWGGDSLLNGAPFDEAALAPGDRLLVAAVELEVVADDVPATPVVTAPVTPANASLASGLRMGRDLARNRSRKLLAALRHAKAEGDIGSQLQIESLRGELQQAMSDLGRMTDERRQALEELAEARRQTANHQNNERLQQELSKQNTQLEGELQNLAARIEDLSHELDKALAAKQIWADEKAVLAAERQSLREENFRLRDQESQRNQEISALSGERALLSEQSEKSRAELQSLNVELASLNGTRSQLCAERDGLQRELDHLRAEVEAAEQEKSRLTNERNELCGERDELRQQNVGLRTDLQSLCEEKSNIAEERESLHRECQGLREQVEGLRANLQALAADKASDAEVHAMLCGERDGYRHQFERLHVEFESLSAEKRDLATERAQLCTERDRLREQNEKLQSEMETAAAERAELAKERTDLCAERDRVRGENDRLQASIAQLDDEIQALTTAKSAFEEERDWLREENKRFADVERQIRAAVADRENMSGELYRALLQAAELQQRVDQYDALETAHRKLTEQNQDSANRIAALQEEVDRLQEERAAVEKAQQSLVDEAASARGEYERLSDENGELSASLAEVREQLSVAAEQLATREEEWTTASAVLREQLASLERQRSEGESQLRQDYESLKARWEAAEQQIRTVETQAAEWQHELAVREKSDIATDELLAEAQRKIVAQAECLAESGESIRRLEDELIEVRSALAALEGEREQWQVQSEIVAEERIEQQRQLAELESQIVLLEAESVASLEPSSSAQANVTEATLVADESSAGNGSISADEVESGVELETTEPEASNDHSAAHWYEAADEAANAHESESADLDRPYQSTEADGAAESTDVASNQDRSEVSDEWDAAATESESSDPVAAERPSEAPAWQAVLSDESIVDDEPGPQRLERRLDDLISRAILPVEREELRTEFVENSYDEPQAELEVSLSPASADSAAFGGLAEEPAEAVECVEHSKPTSYIERYAHLFDDEEQPAAESTEPSLSSPKPAESHFLGAMGAASHSAAVDSSAADDEESIEQYMSKLLQRVRGQSAGPVEAQHQEPSSPANTGSDQQAAGAHKAPAALGPEKFSWAAIADASRSKGTTPAPQTDLEALRALANETARRAISRHSLRKHRRNAASKAIVATLAGVTSLWLMLESSSWFTLQFGTACVALLVGAYWAGQTYRALLQSFRERSIDEADEELVESSPGRPAPLPIDVDRPVVRADEAMPREETSAMEITDQA